MLSKEELKKMYMDIMLKKINPDYEKKEVKAKTISEQIEECESKLIFLEKLQSMINYRDILSSIVDEETISKEYQNKREMMLQIYDQNNFSKRLSARMKYCQDRGKGSIGSFFAGIFAGNRIDREIKIKQDERIRQEITNKYVEAINIKVHEFQKLPISKSTLDNLLLEMDILVEKTENNTPIFDSVKEQVADTNNAIKSSEEKAQELIKNIRIGVAKILYQTQFEEIFNELDNKRKK